MNKVTRSIKYFFIFLVIAFIALLAFVATFDANNYKLQIIEQVENATGRDFYIDGDINLSVFPWIGLTVEEASLGNAEGFSDRRFAAIKQIDIKINALPLLKKQVQINTIRLHGLDVSLEVSADKNNNWSSLTQSETDDAAAPIPEPAAKTQVVDKSEVDEAESNIEEKDDAVLMLESLKIEGFEFVDAVIRYHDLSTNVKTTVSELNLSSSAIAFDEPIDIAFGARIENNQPAIDTRLVLTTMLTFDRVFNQFSLNDFVFAVVADANDYIAQQEKLEFKSDINVSMEDQRLRLESIQIKALGVTTRGDVTVTRFLQAPFIQGEIAVLPFDAHKVAHRVAVKLPAMAKEGALQRIALKTKIELDGEKFQANDFSLTLDSSTLSGWLHLDDISKQKLRYELVFDHLNVNDYLPPVAEGESASPAVSVSATTVAAKTQGREQAQAVASGDEKIVLPVEMMRKLDVQGDFRITELTVQQYQIKQLLMRTAAHKGNIAISPLSMQVLQGQVDAGIKLDVRKQAPKYAFNLDINQLQVGPVVDPLLVGVMGDEPLHMKGAVDVKAAIKTTGDSVNALKKASNGQIVFDMKGTTISGFDPEYYMRSSIAKYIDSIGLGLSNKIMGDYEPRKVTVFDTIHSSVKLANGKARTNDFLMSAKRVEIKADGVVDIMKNTIDVTSSIRLPRGKSAVEKILDEPLYVRTHGPFDALQHDIDTERLKQSTTDIVKNQAQVKIDKEKRRLEKKAKKALKKRTDKLQDKLKERFKGLF
jgi:AsmA protein